MLRYVAAATALRLFSINQTTRRGYRALGNLVGARSRKTSVQGHYVQRAQENLAFVEGLGAIRDGMTVMELGTGWVHWEALFTRAFYDVRLILFDVWDNRQFDGFIKYAGHLREYLIANPAYRPERRDRAIALLEAVLASSTFEAVYGILGARYIIDPDGALAQIADGSVDLVISSDVLEHVDANAVPLLARDLFRILSSGGVAAHQIVEADHLRIYDHSVHPKQYLRYSDSKWKLLFENKVQYINRLQHSDYVAAFKAAGFDIAASAIHTRCDSTRLRIDDRFKGYDRDDLDATVTRLAARKP